MRRFALAGAAFAVACATAAAGPGPVEREPFGRSAQGRVLQL